MHICCFDNQSTAISTALTVRRLRMPAAALRSQMTYRGTCFQQITANFMKAQLAQSNVKFEITVAEQAQNVVKVVN